ncbi:MAG: hypothetical protein AAF641_03220 [Pseudomonadota bacterium]
MDKNGLTGFEELTLQHRSDEFSDQFSTPADPRFWIRIEKSFSGGVVISDMLFGDQDEYVAANAVVQVLHALNTPKPTEIIFRNLGGVDAPETVQTAQKVERMVEAMVMRQRRFIVGREYETRREKVDLVFRFKHFD